ncbi:MAG TPA: hypothetical protein VIQ00_09970, partial [Chitinophagaceae bacterium]
PSSLSFSWALAEKGPLFIKSVRRKTSRIIKNHFKKNKVPESFFTKKICSDEINSGDERRI